MLLERYEFINHPVAKLRREDKHYYLQNVYNLSSNVGYKFIAMLSPAVIFPLVNYEDCRDIQMIYILLLFVCVCTCEDHVSAERQFYLHHN